MRNERIVLAPVEHPRLVLVEGKDDQAFLRALIRRGSGLGGAPVDVHQVGGRDNLPGYLIVLSRSDGIRQMAERGERLSMGVLRDADDSSAGAFQSVQDSLRRAGLPVPSRPGVFVAGDLRVGTLLLPGLRTGAFIVPAAGRDGALEDLLMEAARGDPGLAGACECIDAYLTCIAERAGARVADRDRAKAEAVAFLASREHPQGHIGVGAERGEWPLDSPVLEPLKAFLRDLCADAATPASQP